MDLLEPLVAGSGNLVAVVSLLALVADAVVNVIAVCSHRRKVDVGGPQPPTTETFARAKMYMFQATIIIGTHHHHHHLQPSATICSMGIIFSAIMVMIISSTYLYHYHQQE